MKQNISNYILLNRLAEKNLIIDRDLEVLSNEIVSETKLFGLYVYDPEKHVEFHKELISCDVYFDDLLENKFFYFDIINENKINTKNQFDIYSLCQLLEIDYNELPVLIITNNINSNKITLIKSENKIIKHQLSEINNYCKSRHGFFNLFYSYHLNSLFQKLSEPNFSQIIILSNPVSYILIDYLSFYSLQNGGKEGQMAINQAQQIIRENLVINNYNISNEASKSPDSYRMFLLHCLSRFKDDINDFLENTIKSEVLNLLKNNVLNRVRDDYDLFYNRRINLNKQNPFVINSEKYIDDNFESESQIIFKTFISSYDNFKTYFKDIGVIDYSMFLLPLCKIFEIETNLSVVQWIRNEIKIEMPQYFNQFKYLNSKNYKLTPSTELITKPKEIDFNKKIQGKWTAPSIGQSELIAKTFYLQKKKPSEITDFDSLLNYWKIIRENRNEGSHTFIKNEDDFINVYTAFNSLCTSGIFMEMNNLKSKLRSQK